VIEIHCLADINRLGNVLPQKVIEKLEEDFYLLKDWCDPDGNYTYENFECDLSCGMIVILDGSESLSELRSIGLSEGWDEVVPEDISSFTADGEEWFRVVVVYTNSCTVDFFVKNLPQNLRKMLWKYKNR